MSELKHTPGPWILTESSPNSINLTIRADHPGFYSRKAVAFISRHASATAANAQLIVAAPDLLDACQVAIGHMTGGMDGDWRDCDPVAVLRAAIAKATGASS